MSEKKEVSSVSHPQTNSNVNQVLKHYLDEFGLNFTEFAENLNVSYSTFQRMKREPVVREAVSMFTTTLVNEYEKRASKRYLGHDAHVTILNNLLDAAGYKSVKIDAWKEIYERGFLRIGYVNTPPLIQERPGQERPASGHGVAGFAEMVSSLLGLAPKWEKITSLQGLEDALVQEKIDITAPILRRVPGRKNLVFSQNCGQVGEVCAIINAEYTKDSGKELKDAEILEQTFEGLLNKQGGLSSLRAHSRKQLELLYVKSEVGEYVAKYLSQQTEISKGGVLSAEAAFAEMEKQQPVSIFLVGEEKRSHWVKSYFSERVLFRNIVTLPAIDGSVSGITRPLGFATVSGQEKLMNRINTIIESVDSMESFAE